MNSTANGSKTSNGTPSPKHDDLLRAVVTELDHGIVAGRVYSVFFGPRSNGMVRVRVDDPADDFGGVTGDLPLAWFEAVEEAEHAAALAEQTPGVQVKSSTP